MDATVNPVQLAYELGHTDGGYAIRRFLRHPDDGGGDFSGHLYRQRWELAPEQAERVRARFRALVG